MTPGTSKNFNRYDCYIIEDSFSNYELKSVLKEGEPEGVVVPHAADNISS
jgi:hypothetical protein